MVKLNTAIDPNAPLPNGQALYAEALAVLAASGHSRPLAGVPSVGGANGVPVVAANDTRRARGFKRDVELRPNSRFVRRMGATSHYRSGTNTTATFAARARIPNGRMARLSTAMLTASGQKRAGTPAVTPLSLLRARVSDRRFQVQREEELARSRIIVSTLSQRFRAHGYDIGFDGKPDMEATMRARNTGWALQHLRYA